jgi:hypothetical protein
VLKVTKKPADHTELVTALKSIYTEMEFLRQFSSKNIMNILLFANNITHMYELVPYGGNMEFFDYLLSLADIPAKLP